MLSKIRSIVRAIFSIQRNIDVVDVRLAAIEQTEAALLEKLTEVEQIATGNARLRPTQVAGDSHVLSSMTRLTYQDFIGVFDDDSAPPGTLKLGSKLCRQEDFSSREYRYWCAAIREAPIFHRKQWEFFFICQALFEAGLLRPGSRGLCFGAGIEPLPAVFAAMGCEIVATDQAIEDAQRGGWVGSNEYAVSHAALNRRGICEAGQFDSHVALRAVDMREIPPDLFGKFDFCWSACCFEHLGSLEQGLRFVEQAMHTLKPGGVAVHTTEFNLGSNEATYESVDLSIYRRRDIEALAARLASAGHHLLPVDWRRGAGRLDKVVDVPPFSREPHIRLELFDHECTSIGLIIRSGG